MGLNSFDRKKKEQEKPMNYLELTPVPVHGCETTEEGLVNVLVPRFTDKFFGKYFQPRLKNKYIKANLDKLGSAAWLLIDGRRSVGIIAKELDAQFGEEINPVYDRLTLFLSYLHRNGFIYFQELKKGK